MKLTKENVENCRDIHNEMRKQALEIVIELENLDKRNYDYFESIDSLKFKGENVIIDGYDNYNDKSYAIIPIQYFYEDDWYEQAEETARLKEIERELNIKKRNEGLRRYRELREREEYERLKAKFENDNSV